MIMFSLQSLFYFATCKDFKFFVFFNIPSGVLNVFFLVITDDVFKDEDTYYAVFTTNL